jgi:HK97 family phage prohead protease
MGELLKRAKINDFVRRSYNFEVRAEESSINGEQYDVLTGRPVVYNEWTELGCFSEIIEAGALDGADLTDVRFLVNHDLSKIPLARSRRNNMGKNTMQLTPDNRGLSLDWVKLDINNNADARALYSAVERRDVDGMSFCFVIDADAWEDIDSNHPKRHITKIKKIIEVSAVTFPAYPGTDIYVQNKAALESARQALESATQSRTSEVDTAELLALEKAKFNLLLRR